MTTFAHYILLGLGLLKKHKRKCDHCGTLTSDYRHELNWVGGQGYVEGWYCNDIEACEKRWEAKK